MTDRKTWKAALSVGPAAMNAETLASLAQTGITEIELSSGALAPFYEELDYPNRAGEISRLALENGVHISSVHLPFGPFDKLDPASRDAEVRDFILKTQSELLRAAADAGVGIAVIHPSGEPYLDEEREERLAIACDTIARLTDAAADAGITLALENLPRTCLCRTREEMVYFLERIPALRVCFDTNHCLLQDNADYIRAVGDKIVTLHVSDYDFINERHWLPGEGKNDWERLIRTLEEVNYAGRFLYETGGAAKCREVYANYRTLMGLSS
ncbi:MAG: sugar phosphate isomerase/epimerase family protein [Eubacteriales bacterium]